MNKLIEDHMVSKHKKDPTAKRTMKTEILKVLKDDNGDNLLNAFGEQMFSKIGENELVIPGQTFFFEKLANINSNIQYPYLDSDLGIFSDAYPDVTGGGVYRDSILALFGVGVDGSDEVFGSVENVATVSKGIAIDKIIPFRLVTPDKVAECDSSYYLKKKVGDKFAYYLKEFAFKPTIKSYFSDGTPVTSNSWSSSKTETIDTYMDIPLTISKDDLREHFQDTQGNIANCRLNTICLYVGRKMTIVDPDTSGNRNEYRWVRAYSKVNFNNEPMNDDTKTLDIIYRIYIY